MLAVMEVHPVQLYRQLFSGRFQDNLGKLPLIWWTSAH